MMAISLAVLAGFISLVFLIYGYRNLSGANDWAKLLQALFTLTAFGLAAYWYFVERKGLPHADIEQQVTVVPLAGGLVAIEAHVKIRNLGERLLRIEHINSRLQNVEAATYAYGALAGLRGPSYWNAQRPNRAGGQYTGAELRWPVRRQFDEQVEHEIEPGETDLFVATFLAPCSGVDWVRVATDVYKPGGDPDHPLAWKARNFASIAAACGRPEAARPPEARGGNDAHDS